MKTIFNFFKTALKNIIWFLKMLFAAIVFVSLFILWTEWSDEQSKISNQYTAEDANQDLLYDVKEKMSEKYEVPISRIRVVRNEKIFGLEYEYLVIIVDEEDQEVERYVIFDYDIQQEIDDCLDGTIPEEELMEKYHIGDDVQQY